MDILNTYSRYEQPGQLRLLLGTLIALVAADGLISRYLVTGGMAYEFNPFVKTLITQDNFISIKLAGSFLAAFILWKAYKRLPRASFAIALLAVIWYTALNFWSLTIFLQILQFS